jgi:glucokinase
VHDEARVPTPEEPTEIIRSICALVEQVASDATAVGIGIAGLIGRDGQIRVSPHIPFAAGYDVAGGVASHLHIPVAIDNDANVAAWGEAQVGAGKGIRDLVLVTLGTGIGSGVVCNGALVRGHHGFAGEAGHMVVDRKGETHVTGLPGAWEMHGSGTALGQLVRDAGLGDDGEALAPLIAAGDEKALQLLDRYAWEVAVGIASVAAVLDPELVVLGGGVSDLGEPLRAAVARHLPSLLIGASYRTDLRIALATLGERAGAIGAALLAADPR